MSTRYLVDTSVLIDLATAQVGDYAGGTALVSAITVAELAYGADLGDGAQRHARTERLRAVIRDYEVLPFGVEEAKLYGVLATLATLVRATGRNPRPRRLDLQIAATASAARLPLLTCNPDDFRGIERLVDVLAVEREC